MRLRLCKSCDASVIAEWIKDENVFLKWGGDHFGAFPINAGIIDDKYCKDNGDCVEPDNFSLLRINNNVKNINGYLDRVAIFFVPRV